MDFPQLPVPLRPGRPGSGQHSSMPRPDPAGRTLCSFAAHVIAKAKGLAILSVIKAGFLVTARGGSGIVLARLPDGSKSVTLHGRSREPLPLMFRVHANTVPRKGGGFSGPAGTASLRPPPGRV